MQTTGIETREAVPANQGVLRPADLDGIAERVAETLESQSARGRLQLIAAIVLSLATLGSTWCGYQAQQWGGRQGGLQSAADTAERTAAESTIVGLQRRTQDGLMVLQFWNALRSGENAAAETVKEHMSPMLAAAVQASIDDGILKNPRAAGPLERPEYRLEEEVFAAEQRDEAGKLSAEGQAAGRVASQYVLLTLMFASVLFFGGIGGTFSDRRIRMGLVGIAIVLFGVTAVWLARLPVFVG